MSISLSNKIKLIYIIIYSIIFYISCYFMVPHGYKLWFALGFCFCGFAIPWIPFLAEEKIKNVWILRCLKLVFYIPIILLIIYFVKFNIIAKNNYFIPGSSGMKYTVAVDWELVENSYIGDDFDKFIYCESKEERVKYNTLYTAKYEEVVNLSARVREHDQYDEDEFGEEDIEFLVTEDFGKQQVVSKNIDLIAQTEINYDGEEFVNSGGYFKPEDYGSATWKCVITINRKFDFWEILCVNLD